MRNQTSSDHALTQVVEAVRVAHVTHEYEYGLVYHSNAEGFRSRRDFHGQDSRRRIVVLGDSMVFGAGVPVAQLAARRRKKVKLN